MTDKNPQEGNIFEDVKDEVVGIAKGGAKHPGTKPVLTGATVGAVAGALLPVVTPIPRLSRSSKPAPFP